MANHQADLESCPWVLFYQHVWYKEHVLLSAFLIVKKCLQTCPHLSMHLIFYPSPFLKWKSKAFLFIPWLVDEMCQFYGSGIDVFIDWLRRTFLSSIGFKSFQTKINSSDRVKADSQYSNSKICEINASKYWKTPSLILLPKSYSYRRLKNIPCISTVLELCIFGPFHLDLYVWPHRYAF